MASVTAVRAVGISGTLNTGFNTNMVLIKDTVDCTGLVLGLELCANGGTSAFQPLLTAAVAQPWFVQNTITVLHGDTVDCTGLVLERQTERRVPLASYNVRIVSAINAFTVVGHPTMSGPSHRASDRQRIRSDHQCRVRVATALCTLSFLTQGHTHTHARNDHPLPFSSGSAQVRSL